jgi:hypothetical protein
MGVGFYSLFSIIYNFIRKFEELGGVHNYHAPAEQISNIMQRNIACGNHC